MRFFFATDLHGSNLCFRKFIRTPEFYGVDALFLGGDYSSKSLIACVRSNGGWQAKVDDDLIQMSSRSELDDFRTAYSDRGQLIAEVDEDEFHLVQSSPQRRAQLFEATQRERLRQWTNMAFERLNGKNIPIYQIPGNDEPLYSDEFFNDPPFVPLHRRHVQIDDNLAVLGIGGSNPTPWHTAREYEETEIEQFIARSVREELTNLPLIFFGHVPPWRSGLDNAPALNPDLSYKLVLGAQRKEPVGSVAIRRAIERLHPIVALFGHVHESQGEMHIGKTLCVNPGSAYYNARLLGCILTIKNGRASVQFTEG